MATTAELNLSPRVASIRDWLFEQEGGFVERDLLWHRGMYAHRSQPIGTRSGKAFAYMAERMPVEITTDELIVGRILRRQIKDSEQAEKERWGSVNLGSARQALINSLISPDAHESMAETRHSAGAMTGHMTPDHPGVLKTGLIGIRRRAQARLEEVTIDEERDFLRSAIAATTGALKFARRYSEHARWLSTTATGKRRKELLKIAGTCRRVPAWPARDFHEAAQTLWFVHMLSAMDVGGGHACFCPGRVDQYLAPYYEADLAAGTITHDEAYELLCCLFLKYSEYDPYGTPQTLFVGGQKADGTDTTNPVTYMCLDASTELQMLHPALCLSWHSDLPREVMRSSMALAATGIGFPAIFNDTAIVPGLVNDGVKQEDAVDYMAGSCVEISPIGCSNPWVASGYVNAAKALERVVHRIAHEDREPTWDDFLGGFKDDLAQTVAHNVEITGAHEQGWKEFVRYPFLSCVVNDCVEDGNDITNGGARYNPTQPELVGLANVVDGLLAIRWACFESGAITPSGLSGILRKDWEGEEALRKLMATRPPHYGNGHQEADALFEELAGFWDRTVRSYTNQRGGLYQPGFLCWIIHSIFGERTGATPEGRKSGTALADSVGPVQGRDTNGPTTMLRSVASMDHSRFLGGMVTNIKLSTSMFSSPDEREKTIDLLETFLEMGGFEIQINVVDKKTLVQAQERPDEFGDLIVRVGGYSDYFTRLSKTLQDEIIARTEHDSGAN